MVGKVLKSVVSKENDEMSAKVKLVLKLKYHIMLAPPEWCWWSIACFAWNYISKFLRIGFNVLPCLKEWCRIVMSNVSTVMDSCPAWKLRIDMLVCWMLCPALPERVVQNCQIKCLNCNGFLPCLNVTCQILVCWIQWPALPERVVWKLSYQMSWPR